MIIVRLGGEGQVKGVHHFSNQSKGFSALDPARHCNNKLEKAIGAVWCTTFPCQPQLECSVQAMPMMMHEIVAMGSRSSAGDGEDASVGDDGEGEGGYKADGPDVDDGIMMMMMQMIMKMMTWHKDRGTDNRVSHPGNKIDSSTWGGW